jgi:hypothetical protein
VAAAALGVSDQGKEKQRDCLLFLFLVLQFASVFFFPRPFRPDATMCGAGKGVLGDFFASSTEIFANVPDISTNFGDFLRLQRKFSANAL